MAGMGANCEPMKLQDLNHVTRIRPIVEQYSCHVTELRSKHSWACGSLIRSREGALRVTGSCHVTDLRANENTGFESRDLNPANSRAVFVSRDRTR